MKNQPLTIGCDDIKYRIDQFFKEPDDVDTIIKYVAVFDEYGIPVRDGGSSFIHIAYCPGVARSCRRQEEMNGSRN